MERNLQRIGLLNFVALALAASGGAWLAHSAGSASGLVAGALLGTGALVALASLFQMRLAEREQLENLEVDELQRRGGERPALFAETDLELRPARRARQQFERVALPVFTALLVLLEGGTAVWLWRWLGGAAAPRAATATLVLAVFALLGLVLFLLGKYAAGLARIAGQRLLQPAAAYLLLNALVCMAVAAANAGTWFGITRADRWTALVLVSGLIVLAAETLLNLVLDFYRPRVAGQESRLLYESRLMGLTVRPEGLFRTAAQALDYQFGFRVSETWFYRFLERAVSWLILLQLGVLWLSTAFVTIEPGEQALIERFGGPAPGREVLDAGFYWKLPWPIDNVQRYRTRGLQEIVIGGMGEEEEDHKEPVIVWMAEHNHGEFNFLVASGGEAQDRSDAVPVNLITVNMPVYFEVTNLIAWAREHHDGAGLLGRLATREATRYLVNANYDELMAGGRLAAGEVLRERIQKQADAYRLGVRIVFIGTQHLHPPFAVAQAYEAVVGAEHEKAAKLFAAAGARAEGLPLARAEAARTVAEAETFRLARVTGLAAQSRQFDNQLAAFEAAPTIYGRRLYLEALARSLAPVRKLVIGVTNTQEALNLNLEEKIRTDLLDVTLPPAGSGGNAPRK